VRLTFSTTCSVASTYAFSSFSLLEATNAANEGELTWRRVSRQQRYYLVKKHGGYRRQKKGGTRSSQRTGPCR
jgi:hypothetical protein